MKTFRWTIPELPLTRIEKDGNKGNARILRHCSEITEEDRKFLVHWERQQKRGKYFFLAIKASKVTIFFLSLAALGAWYKGGLELHDDLILGIGYLIALFMRLQAGQLSWIRSEQRYASIRKLL